MNIKQNDTSTTPPILYGTAWKEDDTKRLVLQALNSGFRGIDTANQRRHYFEEAVGDAIDQFLTTSQKTRSDLFLQTKFTSVHGQDHRKPYDEFDSLTNQVKQSFASSLEHLQTDYIDAYILHGPSLSHGIIDADLEIWQAMEELVCSRKVKFLGISNVNMVQVEELYRKVSIKPSFIQNRCFAITQWDQDVRTFSQKNKIIYQGFSLLTANQRYLLNPHMQSLAVKYDKTIPQIIFRFANQVGILPLTGTTNQQHMDNDLNIYDFELTQEEIQYIENIGL
ncbi:TPA: aldo/keto reductase family protein [Legionella pneumophila]|uniref:D-xylose reductase III n=4 Tax=Legionella TaxID=445 RepID=Q5ZTU6_LEGPH|nr:MULTISPECIES: aldo/keto reductase [Legionella]WBV63990.1 aldo/keto reductase [Legionella pneumophila 130b]AAU28131.1 D-xylose reductase III [Legionella pneumophila subsp. pneumophila str. Philadelphia 1]AEW52255.1 D-xylose reductase III [Legionella pneumophila subsp. pneumophila ATCC 43290]AGH53133.1 2,5-diketo-D-gluconic acid reductase [Legionella pneumophila subsp. pneumophila LPE509]AGN14985.1 D-xylose reductase III [Legionella pneumophila subsp. pneumophila str. Thunder Bay]